MNFMDGTTVEIETSLTSPVSVNVGESFKDPSGPGLMMRLLRPRVTVRASGTTLLRVEPAGAPDERMRALFVAVLAMALAALAVLLVKRLR
jgi:hypothetical protein